MLIDKIKKQVLDKINTLDVDVTKLDSYQYNGNPYGVERALIGTSGDYEWSEIEEWTEKVRKFISWLEDDCVSEYIELSSDETSKDFEDRELTQEVINWLYKLLGE